MAEIKLAPSASTASPPAPYAPSWYDRFTDWVDRLPIPAWWFYSGLVAVLVGAQFIIQSNPTSNTLYVFPFVHAAAPAYALALLHYLDKVAAQALARFRPLLSIDDEEYNHLIFRLTTLPARPTFLVTLVALGYGLWSMGQIPLSTRIIDLGFADTALSIHYDNGLILSIAFVAGLAVYHTLHQLRVVEQIYSYHPKVNLYALEPLYAFSALSARTVVGIMLLVGSWYVFATRLFGFGSIVSGLLLFTVFSLLTFVLPLRGAHQLLVAEKEQRLSENGKRQRAAFAELHHNMDAHELDEMDQLNKLLESLELEHTTLERISTWPWHKETFRAVAAALFFPVIVWVLQWVLQRVLG